MWKEEKCVGNFRWVNETKIQNLILPFQRKWNKYLMESFAPFKIINVTLEQRKWFPGLHGDEVKYDFMLGS